MTKTNQVENGRERTWKISYPKHFMDCLPQGIRVWFQENIAKNSRSPQMLTELPSNVEASQHELTLYLNKWTPQEMITSERTT